MMSGWAVYFHGADSGQQYGEDERNDFLRDLEDCGGRVTVMEFSDGEPIRVDDGIAEEVAAEYNQQFAEEDADDRDA